MSEIMDTFRADIHRAPPAVLHLANQRAAALHSRPSHCCSRGQRLV